MLLPDCGHTVEVEGLSYWLKCGLDNSVKLLRCPKCQQPIYNCKRFKNDILNASQDVSQAMARINKQNSIKFEDIVQRLTGKFKLLLSSVNRSIKFVVIVGELIIILRLVSFTEHALQR